MRNRVLFYLGEVSLCVVAAVLVSTIVCAMFASRQSRVDAAQWETLDGIGLDRAGTRCRCGEDDPRASSSRPATRVVEPSPTRTKNVVR